MMMMKLMIDDDDDVDGWRWRTVTPLTEFLHACRVVLLAADLAPPAYVVWSCMPPPPCCHRDCWRAAQWELWQAARWLPVPWGTRAGQGCCLAELRTCKKERKKWSSHHCNNSLSSTGTVRFCMRIIIQYSMRRGSLLYNYVCLFGVPVYWMNEWRHSPGPRHLDNIE